MTPAPPRRGRLVERAITPRASFSVPTGARRAGLMALGATIAVVVALTTDWGVAARAGRALAAEPWPLAAALAAYTLAFVLRAAAWGPLLPAAVPLGCRLRALFAMLAVNHALPGPVGELARARTVSTESGIEFRAAVGSVAAARVVDVGALALLAMVAARLAGGAPSWLRLASAAAVLLPVAAWFVARHRGARLAGADALRVAAFALPSWALEAGLVLVVARAAGVELSLAAAVLATCGAVLAQVAAVLPGGVGTYEAGLASVLVVLGVPSGTALAIGATTHGVKFAYSFATGLPALWLSRRRSARRAATGGTRRLCAAGAPSL